MICKEPHPMGFLSDYPFIVKNCIILVPPDGKCEPALPGQPNEWEGNSIMLAQSAKAATFRIGDRVIHVKVEKAQS